MDGSFDSGRLNIGDFTFRLGNAALPDAASAFPDYALMKSRTAIQQYRDHAGAPQTILQLGILRGGSCALMEALYRPRRHMAVDVFRHLDNGMDALVDHVAADGRDLIADYAISQGDPDAILARWGAGRIDLVSDDASHDYDLTRTAFSRLFPRVRAGGVYVIEDWNTSYWGNGNLSPILADLGRVVAVDPDVASGLHVTQEAIFVTRGAGDPRPFYF